MDPKARFAAHTALYLALAILLPIGFHQFGLAGRFFLPMQIPVLLGGFLAGPQCGLIVGLLAPALSHFLTGMPPTYAVPLMSLELPMYGLIAGLAYRRLKLNIYVSLVAAMLLGRLMFGLGLFVLGMIMELPYSAAAFFASGGVLWAGLPGLVIQMIVIPVIVAAVARRQTPTA
jgi:uncharacterized membrane protein